jgi:hypothetical protein
LQGGQFCDGTTCAPGGLVFQEVRGHHKEDDEGRPDEFTDGRSRQNADAHHRIGVDPALS